VDGGRPHASGFEPIATNQRMEIMAAAKAVEALDGPLEVRSDSIYVVNCFNKKWYVNWLANGWRNSAKKPVANRDLWEPFIERVLARGDVVFQWVKGHGEDKMNELVDAMAVEAAQTQSARASD
jgi:ribonuclease HI